MTPIARYGRHLRIEMLLAIAAYAVALRAFELGIVLGGAVLASGYIADGPRGRRLPRRAATLVAVGLAVWLIWSFIQRPDPEATMSVVGRLACLLGTLRLYERRTSRDDRQIVALAVVAVTASILYSFQLLFGVIVLCFSVQTIHVLMLNRLWTGLETARAERRRVVAESVVPPVEPGIGRSGILQFRLLVGLCSVLAFVAATGVFLIFPRQGARQPLTLGARSGFSADVDLARNDRIEQSNREVFTVRWLDPRGEAVRWPQPLLLRGAVLDRWDPARRRWRIEERRTIRRSIVTDGGREDWSDLGGLVESAAMYTQVVVPRSLASPRLFLRWAPVAVSTDRPRDLVFDPSTFELEFSDLTRLGDVGYAARVLPTPGDAAVETIAAGRAAPIRRPDFPVPEVRAEAVRILEARAPDLLDEVDPGDGEAFWRRRREIARVFTEYLQGPDFRYTLDLRRMVLRSDVDPIVSFLRDQRFGHCEYFASAMCALCQSIGVEARMVTGYVAVEFDDALRQYVVRESNAHAWVEVRTGRWAWREFDPTGTDELEALQAGRRSWADDWRWLYDRFETLWTSRFVAFDGEAQSALAERLGDSIGDRGRATLDSIASGAGRVNRYFQLGPAGYIWLGVVAFAIVIAIIAVASILRRRRRLRRVLGEAAPRTLASVAFYLDLLEAFDRLGRPKPAHRAPMAHLERVAEIRPDIAAAAAPLVRLLYEVRFGGRRLDAAARRDAEGRARTILESASEHRP